MRIYYLLNPELGWDNLVAFGTTVKEMAQNYYEDEDLSELTDKEIENKIDKDNMTYCDRNLKGYKLVKDDE